MTTETIRKAELHCHIEGAAPPALALDQARRYGVDVSGLIEDGAYVWTAFSDFLVCYDRIAELFRTEEDYALLAEAYLIELAEAGTIYSEIIVSPDHGNTIGIGADAYIRGLATGIEAARAKTGIEGRMLITIIRHLGPEAAEKTARYAARRDHPLVTGFGMAGEERFGDPEDYVRAFEIAREAGLGITVHAGELAGWESVASALDHFRPSRIGHGVRSIENPALVQRIAEEGIVLECCPGSNVALKVFGSYESHPFMALKEAGCKVTLNSDDPPYFWTSLKREYDNAARHWDLNDKALTAITKTAIEAAFVDRKTRAALLARLNAPVAAR